MTTQTLPRWPGIVAPVAALWYAFGLSQAIISYVAGPGAAPVLIWLAYGLACSAGLVGAAALFIAPARAAAAFAVSLVCAVIYFGWLYAYGTPAAEDYGIGALVMAVTLTLMLVARRLR
ncbi:hypothetical protein [uncultured Tateyamaria sp.]|uniref:hypothetical protein n=1 Tax=Tateyamaria sp. 1078 TaxID=3417464 RepID=UPI002619A592|nr:hypothetical protein [uncultured Tateyamaria sp.]